MTDYANLRKAVQRRNISCHPDVISEYRAAANPETIRALLAERDALREALQKVRPVIAADRQALLDCHGDGNEIPAADKLGTLGLYEYDGALNAIDAALAQHQGEKHVDQ